MTASSLADAAPHAASPTRVRYTVLSFLCVLSFVFYLDRVCMAQASPRIQQEFGYTNTQMSYVQMAFTLAYGLFQVIIGRVSDRFGSRAVLFAIVVWWSFFTAMTGVVSGLIALIAVRFLFGIGEAGAFPNIARMIARWFPPSARSLPQGLINTCALLGGAVAPLLAAYVIDRFDLYFLRFGDDRQWWMVGWRWMFYLFGMLGIVWVVVFAFWYRDDPMSHPKVNLAERKIIAHGRNPDHVNDAPLPWNLVLRSRNVWLMGFIISCASFVSYLFFTWYPTYLQKARGLDNIQSGQMAAVVLGMGALGSVMGGWVTDWLIRVRNGERSNTRRVISMSSLTLGGILILLTIKIDDPWITTLVTGLSVYALMFQIAPWWGVVADISGRYVATLFGLMNSLGTIGALATQYYFGRVSDLFESLGYAGRDRYDPLFYGYALAMIAGAIGWYFVDANRSAVGETIHQDAGSTS